MRFFVIFLIFVFATGSDFFAAENENVREFFSTDRKFKLLLEMEPVDLAKDSPEGESMTASMLEVVGDESKLKWRRPFTNSMFGFYSGSVLVSARGEFFLTAAVEEPCQIVTSNALRKIESISADPVNQLFELDQLGIREILRIWNRTNDVWRGFFLPEGTETNLSAATAAEFNDKTRMRILEAINALEVRRLKKQIDVAAPQLQRLSGIVAPARARPIKDVEYDFLVLRHNPADRAVFEKMLAKKPFAETSWASFSPLSQPPRSEFSFSEADYQRRAADRLLALWEGKLNPDRDSGSPLGGRLYYLGEVSGTVQLPAPILKDAGAVRIYLVPAGFEKRNWIERLETERLDCILPAPRELKNQITFTFGTVTPGKYMVKAIWDKRRPRTDRERAGPGDYDSGWTGPFDLSAGSSVTNVTIRCDRRSKEGDAYYEADRTAAKLWKDGHVSPAWALPK